MNVLEWVQDSIACRHINRVSQYFPSSSNESNLNTISGADSTISKGTKFASVVDGDEFSKRASDTLVESSAPFSETLWNAPEEEDPFPCVQACGDQDEQAAACLITDSSTGTQPFTLLGTGAVQGSTEAIVDTIDRVKSFRDFLCRPLSCMPNPYEREETGTSQNCELPVDTISEVRKSELDASILDAGVQSLRMNADGSQSDCKSKQEVTAVSIADEAESVTRKAIRESLQRRQAELIEAAVLNKPDASIANRNKEQNGSHLSPQSHFLNGRTQRVSELLKAAEARFEARLNPSPASAGPMLDKETDDEILA